MDKASALLVKIQQVTGCPYLSDLHSQCRMISKQTKTLIMAIPLEQYTLDVWNKAAPYVMDEKCRFSTAEEARERIAAGR